MTAPDYTIQCALGLNVLIMTSAIFYFFCISPRPLVGFEETVSKARFVRDSKNTCPQKHSIFQCPVICDSSSMQTMQTAASPVLHAGLPPPGTQKRVPSSPQDQVPGTHPEDCLGHPLLRGPACCFWSLTTVHKVFTAGREKMPLSGFLLCVRLLLTDWLRHSPVRRSPWA